MVIDLSQLRQHLRHSLRQSLPHRQRQPLLVSQLDFLQRLKHLGHQHQDLRHRQHFHQRIGKRLLRQGNPFIALIRRHGPPRTNQPFMVTHDPTNQIAHKHTNRSPDSSY